MDNLIALVGNPNAGKSTFFNNACMAEEHVGNWHGVTIDSKEKLIKLDGEQIAVADLPGVYSLSPYSYEEAVTRDYLLSHKNCKIINIVDGNNLERNLFLTLELLELGFNPVLCINMANELKKNHVQIDIKNLEKMLGVKVFLINAQNKKNCKSVLNFMINNKDICKSNFDYVKDILNWFDSLNLGLNDRKLTEYQKIKFLEQDEYVLDEFKIDNYENIAKVLESEQTANFVITQRYNFIKKIIDKCLKKDSNFVYGYSKIDKLVLNKWLCFPIFLLIISAIFYLTFGHFGSTLSSLLSSGVENLFTPVINFVNNNVSNGFVCGFVQYALCGSIVSIISFLPQVVLMFLGLFILEDSGYMSRIAFCFEDFLKKVGLSGKSIFALLMSFGCSTTAALSSRNLENKNSKIKTAMLTPYVSCSAKLPIYAVICGAFFPRHKIIVIVSLYILGIVVALLVSFFLNKTILPSSNTSFVMELPKYRLPSAKRIFKNILTNTKQFLLRAGSVLLVFSCIVWILQNCNIKFEYGSSPSMLESISQFLSPIFIPLGFGTIGATSTLLCGFVAKEIIVSTIGIINGIDGASSINDISTSLLLSTSALFFTTSSSLSFLTFALLYLPCISTISVMIKEIGKKWTFFACLIQFAVSYLLSFAIYKIANYFLFYGVISGFISLFVFLLICTFIVVCFDLLRKKDTCRHCPSKKYCNKTDNLKKC